MEKVVRGGSFCGPVGATARTSAGTSVTCLRADTERQARWRSPDGARAKRRSSSTPGASRGKPTVLEMNRRQLRDTARGLGIQLKRGEPDDDIRQKIVAEQKRAGQPLPDARETAAITVAPEEPVTEPTPAPPAMPRRSHEDLRPPNGDWGVDQGLMHFDGAIGRLWNDLGDDRYLEVDGHALGNVVCDLGEGITRGHHDTNHALTQLQRIRQQLPDDCDAARKFDVAINRLDAPARPAPDLPGDAPEPVRNLMAQLNNINLVRRGGDEGMRTSAHGTHETDILADAAWKWSRGELAISGWNSTLDRILGMRHEAMEGWSEIRTAVFAAQRDVRAWGRRKRDA